MSSRVFGGILLIVGTTVGGGMLALPVVTANSGFIPAILLMISTWLLMTLCAFWILEVNLWLPPGSNLISMAKVTLGRPGQIISWLTYLLLFYCLLAAYIAGGGDVVHALLQNTHFAINGTLSAILFMLILSYVVLRGIQSVDWVNRLLLSIKLLAYVILVTIAFPHVRIDYLTHVQMAYVTMAVMPIVTSFGFAIIVPNLRSYLDSDVAKLRRVIAFGSLAPVCLYILWEIVTVGVIQLEGAHGLAQMANSGHPTSELMTALATISQSEIAHSILEVFTSFCVGTSFLGVSLAMFHFLHDGLKLKHTPVGKSLVYVVAYLPPLLMVVFYPNAFIKGLSFAGIICVVLLVLMPALMVYSGRYRKGLASDYQVFGGRPLLIVVIVMALLLLSFSPFI